MFDQKYQYVRIVLEERKDLSPREEKVEKNVRDAWCEKDMITRVLRTHIPRSIYVNEYIHHTVSLFDYFSKPVSEALMYLIRANVKTLNRYASRARAHARENVSP